MSKTLYAQDSVIPAGNADIVIPVFSTLPQGYMNVACDMNYDLTNAITAVVVEEENGLNQLTQFKLVLYNGVINNVITITPASLTMGLQPNSNPYPSFNLMYNPDIVLLNNGSKAIITFDTDYPSFGAHWVEYDVNTTTLTITQNTIFYGGCVPITHMYGGVVSYCHTPRVDRSYDNSNINMFAVVAMHDVHNNGNEVPTVTYFEDNSGSFQFNSLILYQPIVPSTATTQFYNPDIAVGFHSSNNEFCSAVSYVENDITNPYIYKVNQTEFKPIGTILNTNYVNSVSTTYPFIPNIVRPHICAPPTYNTSPISDIPFALCYSNSPFEPMWVNNNLYYAHYSVTTFNTFNPDAQNTYATSYNGVPVIEYMQDTPSQQAREACMAWPAILNASGTTLHGIYALMDPFINSVFYDWSQVNLNTISTSNNSRYGTAIAGTWENGIDRYVIAWLKDSDICLKIRNMHATNYKHNTPLENSINISAYPNPAHSVIHLVATGGQLFTLVNALGIILKQGKTLESGLTNINTQELANGIYFISIDGKTISVSVNH